MGTRRSVLVFVGAVALVAALIGVPDGHLADAQTAEVTATVETEPVPSDGDAADDPGVWVHPSDPSLSTIIGTDKEGGLGVYDLDGSQIQYLSGFRPNNVDVLHGFPPGGQPTDLVLSSDRDDDVIAIHRIDPDTRQLTAVGPGIATDMNVLGICTYRDGDGGYFVFVTPEDGGVARQWELTDGGSTVTATLVREIPIDSIAEGCVVDDEQGRLYIAEETVGIWRYDADPGGGTDRVSVDSVGARLDDDVEGLALYRGPDTSGYLIASSQGSDEFVVYDREGDNPYVTSFTVTGGAIDEVTGTDGIEVMSLPLGPAFPAGLFIAQDGDNDPENQNFKLVPWDLIARSSNPELIVAAGPGPRGEVVEVDPGQAAPAPPPPSAPPEWTQMVSTGGADEEGPVVFQQGQQVTLTFPDLNVPGGAMIRNANVQFTAQQPDDNPVVLTLSALVDGQPTTAVTWAPAPWEEAGRRGPFQQTPDLATIIREAVGGADWESGDSLTLLVTADGAGSRTADGVEARLTLEYAEGDTE